MQLFWNVPAWIVLFFAPRHGISEAGGMLPTWVPRTRIILLCSLKVNYFPLKQDSSLAMVARNYPDALKKILFLHSHHKLAANKAETELLIFSAWRIKKVFNCLWQMRLCQQWVGGCYQLVIHEEDNYLTSSLSFCVWRICISASRLSFVLYRCLVSEKHFGTRVRLSVGLMSCSPGSWSFPTG